MLCYPFSEQRLSTWPKPYIVQPKINGNRCRAIISDGKATLLSSQGNEIKSVPHINKELLYHFPGHQAELDGELYKHGMPLNEIRSIVSKQNSLDYRYQQMEFHIFDTVCDLPQGLRLLGVKMDFNPDMEVELDTNLYRVKILPNYLTNSVEEIMEILGKFYSAGFEGVVVRNSIGYYKRSRSTDIMKLKPMRTGTFLITSYQEEISIDGVPKDSLGALTLVHNNQEFNVGTGPLLTRANRFNLWQDRKSLKGKLAKIRYQELTAARGVPYCPSLLEII